jgi:hypothetical protein
LSNLSSVTSDNLKANEAASGTNGIVDALDLSAVISARTLAFSPLFADSELYSGFEDRSVSYPISLGIFFATPTEVAVGGANARDFSHSGFPEYPCLTFEHALSLYFPGLSLYRFAPGIELTKPQVFSESAIRVTSANSPPGPVTVAVTDSGAAPTESAFFRCDAAVVLTDLRFSLTASLAGDRSCFLLVAGQTTSLTGCSFAPLLASPVTIPLFEVSGGSLVLTRFATPTATVFSCTLLPADAEGAPAVATQSRIYSVESATYADCLFSLGSSLPATGDEDTAVLTASGTLSLVRCTLKSGAPAVTLSFVKILSGVTTVTQVVLDSLRFDSNPAFDVTPAGSLTARDMTATGIQTGSNGLIRITAAAGPAVDRGTASNAEDADVRLHNNTFTGVTRGIGNGAVVDAELTSSQSLYILGGAVEGRCEAGNGGGMRVKLWDDGEFRVGTTGPIVEDTPVANCVVPAGEGGLGGGIYVDVLETQSFLYQLTSILFKNNTAWKGRDVYLVAQRLQTAVQISKFSFLFAPAGEREGTLMGRTPLIQPAASVNLFVYVRYTAETIYAATEGCDDSTCGSKQNPCLSVDYGLGHILRSTDGNRLIVENSATLNGPADLTNVDAKSRFADSSALIDASSFTLGEDDAAEGYTPEAVAAVVNTGTLTLSSFDFTLPTSLAVPFFSSSHIFVLLDVSFLAPEDGVTPLAVDYTLFSIAGGSLSLFQCSFGQLHLRTPLFSFATDSSSPDAAPHTSCSVNGTSFGDIATDDDVAVVCAVSSYAAPLGFDSCSFTNCSSRLSSGSVLSFSECGSVTLIGCSFDGASLPVSQPDASLLAANEDDGTLCLWTGSLVTFSQSGAVLDKVAVRNSSKGALAVDGGSVTLSAVEFNSNAPYNTNFPSFQRNIFCTRGAALGVLSLVRCDPTNPHTSLWIRNTDCNLTGLPTVYGSELFVPVLTSVAIEDDIPHSAPPSSNIVFSGMMLMPCADLGFAIVTRTVSDEVVFTAHHIFSSIENETCATGSVPAEQLTLHEPGITLGVWLTFTGHATPQHTEFFPLKPAGTESVPNNGTSNGDGADRSRSSMLQMLALVLLTLAVLLGVGVGVGTVAVCLMARRVKQRVMDAAPTDFLLTPIDTYPLE